MSLINGIRSKVKNNFSKLKGNKLFGDYIAVFLGQNAGSVFSILSMIIALRIISSDMYGVLVVIQTYCLLISNIFSLRTFNGVIKYLTQAQQDNDLLLAKKIINTGFFMDVIAGAVAFVFGFVLLSPITQLMGWQMKTVEYVYMYMPIILFYPLLSGTPVGILRKTGNFKLVNIIHASNYGAQLLVLLCIWALKLGSFRTVLFVYVLAEITECVALLISALTVALRTEEYKGFYKAGFTKNKAFIKYNFSYGILLTFDQLLGNVSTLLINKYVGNLATAYLKIITRICNIMSKLTNPIGQIFYPQFCSWISEKRYKKAFNTAKKYFLFVMGFGCLVMGIMYVTYDLWIGIFDASMTSVKSQSMLYLVYSLLTMSIICFNQISFALDMMKINLALVCVFNVLYIIALVPCVKAWGVSGYLVLQILQLLFVVLGKYIYISVKTNKLENGVDYATKNL